MQQQQFKVGDQVRHMATEKITYITHLTAETINHTPIQLYVLWQPTEGEYVWNTHKRSLCLVKNIVEDQFGLSFGCYSDMNGVSSSGYYRIDDLEPFIGELPSFLQN